MGFSFLVVPECDAFHSLVRSVLFPANTFTTPFLAAANVFKSERSLFISDYHQTLTKQSQTSSDGLEHIIFFHGRIIHSFLVTGKIRRLV